MTTRNNLIWLATAVVMTGCVPSLHPLFTAEDLVFDRRLEGMWVDAPDGGDSWTFQKSSETAYDLTVTDRPSSMDKAAGQRASHFEAHLLRLGEFLFLDISPVEPGTGTDLYKGLLIGTHCFFKVSIEPDVLRLAPLNLDWVEHMIAEKKVSIAYDRLDEGGIILIASTKELRAFALAAVEDATAFPETEFHRRKGAHR